MQKALLIDFDGTLALSLDPLKKEFFHFLKHKCGDPQNFDFSEVNGRPLRDVLPLLIKKFNLRDTTEGLVNEYFGRLRSLYETVLPNTGAVELLTVAREAGFRVSIVTANRASVCWKWVDRVGLREFVFDIVGEEESPLSKPDPAPYLLALKRAEGDPARSLAVEDSFIGATSAVGSGVPTYFLCDDPNERVPPGVTATIGSLSSLIRVIKDV
jgi:phosphoglycolate phosphatase